jgi:hypothetical protein
MSKTSTEPSLYDEDMTPAIVTCLKSVTPHVETILAMLSVGHTRTAAAKAVGVKPWYFFAILREGKIVKGRCHDILKGVITAEGKAQVNLEAIVIADAKVNVKTAQWLLARRFRLKERHEADVEVLKKRDLLALRAEELKLAMLAAKLKLLTNAKAADLNGEGWRELMGSASESSKTIKSMH